MALRSGFGGGGGGRFAVEGEELCLIVLDGMEESVVVGGTGGGDLPQEKMDVAGCVDHRPFHRVQRGEGGVVALD